MRLHDYSTPHLVAELRRRDQGGEFRAVATEAKSGTLGSADTRAILDIVRQRQKVIWGTDNRLDMFEVQDPDVRSSADAVALICWDHELRDNGDGTSTLRTRTFGRVKNLCPNEPFRDQPTAGFCSGFLVAPEIVATAGHCLDAGNVTRARFVFGYGMLDAERPAVTIANQRIARGAAMIDRQLTDEGPDWALVRLDRPLSHRPPLPLRHTGMIANRQPLYVIGHPCGLPAKYAPGAAVRDNTPASFFLANLDTYGGNSGSPIFNRDTHHVEGILVRGAPDFVTVDGCTVSLVIPEDNHDNLGEACTRITALIDCLPPVSQPSPPAPQPDRPQPAPPAPPIRPGAPSSIRLFGHRTRTFLKGLLGDHIE